MKPIDTYAEHMAEEIAEAEGNGATCTILEIASGDRPNITYFLEDGADAWIGTLHDGEALADIEWDYNDPRIAGIVYPVTLPLAAIATGVPYSTLAQAVREGRVTARRAGGIWLTTGAAVEAALAAGRIKPRVKIVE